MPSETSEGVEVCVIKFMATVFYVNPIPGFIHQISIGKIRAHAD